MCQAQWSNVHLYAGPWDTTIVQVTPTCQRIEDKHEFFRLALQNIFSITLKPINAECFMRAVKAVFDVHMYEAFSQGPDGLFREDMSETMVLRSSDVKGNAVRDFTLFLPAFFPAMGFTPARDTETQNM